MPPPGKYLQRYPGFVDGDGIKDSSIYFDDHGIVIDALGRDAGKPAFRVRGLSPTNAPTTVFQVNKDGTVTWAGQPINVTSYGAKGDGVTDDTAAIRAAIAAATAAGGGGVVAFPGGPSTTYLIGASGATYSLTTASGLTLAGTGAVLKRKSGNAEKLIGSGSAVTDLTIQGLTLDNQDAVVASGGLVYVANGSSRITIERCRLVGLAYVQVLLIDTGTTQNTYVRVQDCSFERTLANSTAGNENSQSVTIYDASYVRVVRCRFTNCNALEIIAANTTACPATAPARHIYLTACAFEQMKPTSVFVDPVASAAMAHVYVESNSFLNIGKEIEKGALVLGGAGTTTNVVVRNNVVRDWAYSGSSSIGATSNAAIAISIGGTGVTDGVVIEGNLLDGATLAGVSPPTGNYGIAVTATNVLVRGNTVRRTGYAGIKLEGTAGSQVAKFVVDGNDVSLCGLHNDSNLKAGGITVVDYATDGSITNNVCVDNGAGGGAGGQDAGIAVRTGTSATTIRDVKLTGNHCHDTRSPGSKTQLFGIRVGDTGSADSAQPTRITLQSNDVGGVNVDGGNATAGLYYQRTVDLGYVVSGNAGFNEAITSLAAANNLALPMRATGLVAVYRITGATQINLLANTNWPSGAMVTLVFSGAPTVKHGQTSSGVNRTMLLAGSVDFVASANDTLTLVYDGDTAVGWYEVTRSVI